MISCTSLHVTRVAHALLAPHSAGEPESLDVRMETLSQEPNMQKARYDLLRLQADGRVREDTPGQDIAGLQAARMALEPLRAPEAARILAEMLATCSGAAPPPRLTTTLFTWRARPPPPPLNPMTQPSCQPMQESPTTPAAPLEEPTPSRGPHFEREQVPPPPGGEGYYTVAYWEWKTKDGQGFWKWLWGERGPKHEVELVRDI